jgi:hypothetical protein
MKLSSISFLAIIFIIAGLSSCSLVQQGTELATFTNCDFRLESVKNVKLAGISIQNKTALTDLGFADMSKVLGVIGGGTLPLTFDLNLEAKNPNDKLAAMNRLEWILLLDKQEIVSGVLTNRIEIGPNSSTTFPININFDLMKALSGKTAEALLNLAFSLAGTGATSKITLKAKPTIIVGNKTLQYPGYIHITQKFGN